MNGFMLSSYNLPYLSDGSSAEEDKDLDDFLKCRIGVADDVDGSVVSMLSATERF